MKYKMINRLVSLLLFQLLITSCSHQGKSTTNYVNLSAEDALELIETNSGNDKFVLLDTRTISEYHAGHLKNSTFINYNSGDYWKQIVELDTTKSYLIYCHSGGRSKNTARFMAKNGFQQVYNMKGGIVSWKRKGFNVVSD